MNDFGVQFNLLNEFLKQNEGYWRYSPYQQPNPEWVQQNPELAQACYSLDEGALQHLETCPNSLIEWLDLPRLSAYAQQFEPQAAVAYPVQFSSRWHVGVPGRKQAQIKSFIEALHLQSPHIVDWCCGKSFLGRTLLQCINLSSVDGVGGSLTGEGYEKDSKLCQVAEDSCKRAGIDMRLKCLDVLNDKIQLRKGSHVLALHACGDLHRRLVRLAASEQIGAVTLAPCCYSLWLSEGTYKPLSGWVQQSDLQLNRHHLNLAVQESVTSSQSERDRLSLLNEWRLGFDELQKKTTGVDAYLPTPSLPKSALNWGFEQVCLFLAQAKSLVIPGGCDWRRYEALGRERWQRTRRLQLVSQGFRRLLELWLVYDLALFLQQAGYRVQISTFCDRKITPRNIMLTGIR